MHLKGNLKYSSSDFCNCEIFLKICKESVNNMIIQIYSVYLVTYFLSGVYMTLLERLMKYFVVDPRISIIKNIAFVDCIYFNKCKDGIIFYETFDKSFSNVFCKHLVQKELLNMLYFCFCCTT